MMEITPQMNETRRKTARRRRKSFAANSSNSTTPPVLQDDTCDFSTDWVDSSMPVYIYIISALGILFNLVVLLVFVLHKKACTVAEIYLSNMAAADFLLVLFLPFWAVYISNGYNWIFGDLMCKIVPLCIVINYNCSVYFLVLVCIDRYLALVHPLSQCKMRRRKYAKLNCVLVWCLCLILGIPTFMCREVKKHIYTIQHNDTYKNETIEYSCRKNCSVEVETANEVIQTVFPFIIPIFIITFCTVKIISALKQQLMEGARTQKMEHKATILILVVLLAFLICWLPFHIVKMVELLLTHKIIESSCSLEEFTVVGRSLVAYFGFFNSDLNPVLYVMVGKNFRKKMWEVFTGNSSERRSSSQRTMTTRSSLASSQKRKVSANGVI